MKTKNFILDSFALLAYFQGEPGGKTVRDILKKASAGSVSVMLSVVSLGEIYYIVARKRSKETAVATVEDISRLPVGTVQTKLFKSNRSQAMRLPKEIAFPESVQTVEITAVGNRRIIAPAGQSWEEWFDGPGVSADFMPTRLQPADQGRDSL